MIFTKKRYSINDLIFKKDLNYQKNLNLFLVNYYEKDHFFYWDKKEDRLFSLRDLFIIKKNLRKVNKDQNINLICQKKSFYNLNLKLKKGVFIPQYDTEELVNLVLENEDNKKGLEVGVGSGAIILSILKNSNNQVDGIDISRKAIKLTKYNQIKNSLNFQKINLLKKDLFKITKKLNYDFIVANPPYVSLKDPLLTEEAKKIQPKKGLFAKENGLYFYKYLISNWDLFLKENGTFYFEIGLNQAKYLQKYLLNFKNLNFYFKKDFNNIDRYLVIKKEKENEIFKN